MMMTMTAASPSPPQTLSDLRTKTTTHSIVAAAANRRSSTITSSQSRRSAVAYTVEEDDGERRLRRRARNLNPNELVLEPVSERGGRKMRLKGSKGRRGQERTVEKEEPKQNRTTHKLLKVIGGTAKRKQLLSPADMDVRPMMEVVKGATFDILQVAGGCHAYLQPGRWLDLYSGTGSVGIEALSRGCSEVHFVEIDPWVVSNVLRPNLEWTGFLDASVIHTIPVERFLEQAEHNTGKSEPFDYISVTPPYTQVDYKVLMDQFSTSPLIGEDTFMVVEYPIGMTLLDSCGILIKIVDRRFGRTNLAIYGPVWAERRKK
ncbi:putative rRNA methyltransferase YlbH [Drosera capensis]